MPPNMMTNEEEMQLTIGHGHVLYTGGADGTDTLAEEMAREYGMQIEVIVPPNHPLCKVHFTCFCRIVDTSRSCHRCCCSQVV